MNIKKIADIKLERIDIVEKVIPDFDIRDDTKTYFCPKCFKPLSFLGYKTSGIIEHSIFYIEWGEFDNEEYERTGCEEEYSCPICDETIEDINSIKCNNELNKKEKTILKARRYIYKKTHGNNIFRIAEWLAREKKEIERMAKDIGIEAELKEKEKEEESLDINTRKEERTGNNNNIISCKNCGYILLNEEDICPQCFEINKHDKEETNNENR